MRSFCLCWVAACDPWGNLLLAAARCPASLLSAPAMALKHPPHPWGTSAAISSATSVLWQDMEKSEACQRGRAGMLGGLLADYLVLSHPIWSPSPIANFCFSAVTVRSSVWAWCHWKHGWDHSLFGNTLRRRTIDSSGVDLSLEISFRIS